MTSLSSANSACATFLSLRERGVFFLRGGDGSSYAAGTTPEGVPSDAATVSTQSAVFTAGSRLGGFRNAAGETSSTGAGATGVDARFAAASDFPVLTEWDFA